ncbi:hypothetical protein [Chelatococcus asaccharovorans]|uniref:hypothetical protein n=1 Tax=Chelatococcus asaccharovorans TaxID=28210 RepID=UPI003CC9C957
MRRRRFLGLVEDCWYIGSPSGDMTRRAAQLRTTASHAITGNAATARAAVTPRSR